VIEKLTDEERKPLEDQRRAAALISIRARPLWIAWRTRHVRLRV